MERKLLDNKPVVCTTVLSYILGVSVTVSLLDDLGIKAALRTKVGTYWYKSDILNIRVALCRFILNNAIDYQRKQNAS